MMRALASIVLLAAGCGGSTQDASPTASASPPSAEKATEARSQSDETAYFAGGCFWGVEHYLEQMDGVHEVESGYMGGHVPQPSYEQVVQHTTGHLEAVRVRFDSSRVSYRDVAKRFFEIHDPTQTDGQGPDIGSQYLSAVFYADDAQREVANELIATLESRGFDVATTVREADTFYEAESYHQDYYAKTQKKPYCHTRVRRFGD